MGLLDIFKSPKKQKRNATDAIFRKMENEIKEMQSERSNWNRSFEVVCTRRNHAREFEKNSDFESAINLYLENIAYCKKDKYVNHLNNYVHDIDRVIILYGKLKYNDELRSFLENMISEYPRYEGVGKWKIRLSKLNNVKLDISDSLNPLKIKHPIPGNPTIGERIRQYKCNVHEFNFYYDMPMGMDTSEYLWIHKDLCIPENKAELSKYKKMFEKLQEKGKVAENEGNYKKAIEVYEKMIVEECEDEYPFERLMLIYKKLKWKEQEFEILTRSIQYFSNLRSNQEDYVLNLARKYNMEQKALEYINANKKIFYFGGAFTLYNPYLKIEKWKERLDKLI